VQTLYDNSVRNNKSNFLMLFLNIFKAIFLRLSSVLERCGVMAHTGRIEGYIF